MSLEVASFCFLFFLLSSYFFFFSFSFVFFFSTFFFSSLYRYFLLISPSLVSRSAVSASFPPCPLVPSRRYLIKPRLAN